MNLEYLKNKTDGKDRMAHWFVSIAMLAAEEFENELGDFGKKLTEYSEGVIEDKKISQQDVKKYIKGYKELKENNFKFFESAANQHVKDRGFVPYNKEGKIDDINNQINSQINSQKSKIQIFKSLFQRVQTS